MRKYFTFGMLMIMLLIAFANMPHTYGQTQVTDTTAIALTAGGDAQLYGFNFSGTLKNTDTAYSQIFSRRDADSLLTFWFKFSNARDSIKLTTKLLATGIGGTWYVYKTLNTADSTSSIFYKRTYFDLEAPVYRLMIYGTAGNGYTTNYRIRWYLRKHAGYN